MTHPLSHLLVAFALSAATVTASAGKAHEHGVARLDVAVEHAGVTLDLGTPLDNLLGFEHAPRTEAERGRVAAALTRLRDAAALFRIDPAAGCTLAAVVLVSAPLGLGAAGEQDKGGHGELEGHYEFRCRWGDRARFVEVGLFDAFAALLRVDVQIAAPQGQMKATLARPAARVSLVR